MFHLIVPALDEHELCDLANSLMVPASNLGAHFVFPDTALLLFTESGEMWNKK